MNEDEFIPTRHSLLSRLKSSQDQASWELFFNTYSRMIHGAALRAGLTHAEAQDVVQETMIVAARKLPGFKYDPAVGSFKSWLLLITRRRIEKQLKKRLPGQTAGVKERSAEDTERTATWARVPDPQGLGLEAAWEAEWEKHLWQAAIARVKAQFKPKQFQMFDLYVLKQWPVKDVARALGVSVAHIYVVKHRVASALKREFSQLRDRMDQAR